MAQKTTTPDVKQEPKRLVKNLLKTSQSFGVVKIQNLLDSRRGGEPLIKKQATVMNLTFN